MKTTDAIRIKRAARVAVSVACLAAAPSALANGALEFSADAEVLKLDATLLNGLVLDPLAINIVSAGPIPAKGGSDSNSLATIGPGSLKQLLLAGSVAEAEASGGAGSPAGLGKSHAFASVAQLKVGLGPVEPTTLTIGADVIQSMADVGCDETTRRVSSSGKTVIANLVINGKPIALDGMPNQMILLPGIASVIIDEQISSTSIVMPTPPFVSDKASITVNAIHVRLLNPISQLLSADLVIGHSHADLTCLKRRP